MACFFQWILVAITLVKTEGFVFDLAWTDMNVTAPEQDTMEKIALYVCILLLSLSDCIFVLYSLTVWCQNKVMDWNTDNNNVFP